MDSSKIQSSLPISASSWRIGYRELADRFAPQGDIRGERHSTLPMRDGKKIMPTEADEALPSRDLGETRVSTMEDLDGSWASGWPHGTSCRITRWAVARAGGAGLPGSTIRIRVEATLCPLPASGESPICFRGRLRRVLPCRTPGHVVLRTELGNSEGCLA